MLKPVTMTSAALGAGLLAFGCSGPADDVNLDTTAAGIGEDQWDPQQEQLYRGDEQPMQDMQQQPGEPGKENAEGPHGPSDQSSTEGEQPDDKWGRFGGWGGGFGGWGGGFGGNSCCWIIILLLCCCGGFGGCGCNQGVGC